METVETSAVQKDQILAVVALGSSAGGLESLTGFFDAVPDNPGAAFVVVQHGQINRESHLAELLQKHTDMPVIAYKGETRLDRDKVYVAPPGALVALRNDKISCDETGDDTHTRFPIDYFFSSLADTKGRQAVGIVLSGTGSDGVVGLKALKEKGALTIAESPETAKFSAMPENAINAGVVDLIKAPDDMAEAVAKFTKRAQLKKPGVSDSQIRERLDDVFRLMSEKSGHNFQDYKKTTLVRRVKKRMDLLGVDSVETYLTTLSAEAAERQNLFQEVLVGVTYFFRDPAAFQEIREKIIPALFEKHRESGEPIRVWVPGCSTGEEAYTLAILFYDYARAHSQKPNVQIFASDLDDEAIEMARRGKYSQGVSQHVPQAFLDRYFKFSADEGLFQIADEVRNLIVFCVHNLLTDPPFADLDLISCRNVLIYMDDKLQRRIFDTFASIVDPGGFLFLGMSESVRDDDNRFAVFNSKHHIFQNDQASKPPVPRSRSVKPTPQAGSTPGFRVATPQKAEKWSWNLERTLFREFGPAVAVINEASEVVYLSGPTSRFLRLPDGPLNSNILSMADEGIRYDLRAAIYNTIRTGDTTHNTGWITSDSGELKGLDYTVRRLRVPGTDETLYAVVFRHAQLAPPSEEPGGKEATARPGEDFVRQLEQELINTKQHLRTAMEDMETSNEELRSGNEELVSMNEQLQSANEELQTSQEELQSVNEEMDRVNAELRAKVTDLDAANSDLQNLFQSTQIPTIFLDKEKRIKRFTPEIRDLVRIIDSDIGRPITDIAPSFKDVELGPEIDKVMHSLQRLEREIYAEDSDKWYSLRIHPYTTVNNVLDGVVLTFVDVTALKKAEEEKARFAALVESSRDEIIFKQPTGIITSWNQGAQRLYGYTPEEAIGRHINFLIAEEERERIQKVREQVLAGKNVGSIDTVKVTKSGERLDMNVTLSRVVGRNGDLLGISTIGRDITERRRMEQELRTARQRADDANAAKNRFLAQISHELRTPLGVVQGFLDLIFEGGLSEGETSELVERTRTNMEMVKRLIDDILDLAKIEEGKMVVEENNFTPREPIESVTDALSTRAQSKGLTLRTQFSKDFPDKIAGDAVRLRQVLYNVVINAIKYTESGSVDVSASREKAKPHDSIVIDVTDTGAGISDDAREVIFEPFHRLSHNASDSYGSGLGLYLCRGLAEALGGSLVLKESQPGKGSTFSLRIPAKPPKAERKRKKGKAGTSDISKMRVLVAEDNTDNQVLLRFLLEDGGATVEFADDGERAVEKASKTAYDAVLMDLQMPKKDGYEALSELRSQNYPKPVIALTAHAMEDERKKCLENGFSAYLTKPVSQSQLLQTLADVRNSNES